MYLMENGNSTTVTMSDQLQRKMHFTGKVIKTSKAGAIVDIGIEKPALLHISQIITPLDSVINRVEDRLKVDQLIEVWVKNIRNDRIELTMHEPLKYEWRELAKDMVVKGKVVEIQNFGAFVDIGAERPGLMHISELSRTFVKNTSDVVKVGDEIEIKIIDFDRRKKQIKLSMKALQPEIVEVVKVEEIEEPLPQNNRRERRDKRKFEKVEHDQEEDLEPTEPELTAMELAWQAAKDKANHKRQPESKTKKSRLVTDEQENILSRTLENRK
jgi:predicted RNA-binding protein with RPS1 domain